MQEAEADDASKAKAQEASKRRPKWLVCNTTALLPVPRWWLVTCSAACCRHQGPGPKHAHWWERLGVLSRLEDNGRILSGDAAAA